MGEKTHKTLLNRKQEWKNTSFFPLVRTKIEEEGERERGGERLGFRRIEQVGVRSPCKCFFKINEHREGESVVIPVATVWVLRLTGASKCDHDSKV